MQEPMHTHAFQEEEETFSFKKMIRGWIDTLGWLLQYWRILVVAGIIGAIIGTVVAFLKPITYTARLSFVVEDSKGSGGGSLAALAGQIGFDLSGISSGGGILAGDNVLELLKSRSLLRKTLLTPYQDSSTISLADQYANVYHWKDKWENSSKVGRRVDFPVNKISFSRLEDSLLQLIITNVNEKELSISKPDKKLGFFEMTTTTRDEQLSALICERLLKETTDFYIETKTRRARGNVERLQRRVDSIEGKLNIKTYSAVSANRGLLDANPAYAAQEVNAEITYREKMVQSTVYAELMKNLETSKTALIQETPTIQVVDRPELPLKRNRLGYLLAILAGGLIASTLSSFYLLFKKNN